MKKHLFITGFSSVLGRSLKNHLDSKNYEITALSRKPFINTKNIKWVQGDLTDTTSFKHYLNRCDTLIHLGAITHSTKIEKYSAINSTASINLFEQAKKAGIKKIIYISSYTAGKDSGAYGNSKYKAEKYLEKKIKNWVIIRPSEVFGTSKKTGIDKLIIDATTKRIHFYPKDVPLKLRPIHIEELTEFISEIIVKSEFIKKRIDLIGPESLSIVEILKYAEKYRNLKFILFPIPKDLMFLIYKLSSYVNLSTGLVPDQIPRLYRPKNQLQTDLEIIGKRSFLEYLKIKLKFKIRNNF